MPSTVLLLLLSAPSPAAQIVGGAWMPGPSCPGADPGGRLGAAVAPAGDVDGDGIPDLLAGAPDASPAGLAQAGSVLLLSGADGTVLLRMDGSEASAPLGAAVAGPGDVDGDGIPDLLLGAPQASPGGLAQAGSLFLRSGATGALLLRVDGSAAHQRLGAAVAGPGDTDLDGIPDLLGGAPGADPGGAPGAGSAFLLSGAGGTVLHQWDGFSSGEALGASVAAAGDLDRDGHPDLLVGAPGSLSGAGAAWAFSGDDGSTIHAWQGGAGEAFGTVAGIGDATRDGVPDVAIGAPAASPGGSTGAGRVRLYSGSCGCYMRSFDGPVAGAALGASVAGPGDVDGDGAVDLLLGAPGAGGADLYTALSGVLLARFERPLWQEAGTAVAGAGDLDGDGRADVLLGLPGATPGGIPACGLVATAGFDPFLTLEETWISATSGVPVQAWLDFPASEAGMDFVLLASLTGTGPTSLGGVEVPLTPDSLYGRMLAGWVPPVLSGSPGTLDAAGDATVTILSDPWLAPWRWRTAYLAAVSWDPAGPAVHFASVARRLTVMP